MIFLSLYRFFLRRKAFLFLITFLITAGLLFFARQLRLEEDITKFLPKDKQSREITEALQGLKISDKLIITIFKRDSTVADPEQLATCAEELADTLQAASEGYISEIRYRVDDAQLQETYNIFNTYLPVFLEEKDYEIIDSKLPPDSIDRTLETNYRTLLSPGGIVLGKFIQNDPLSLTGLALKKIQAMQLNANYELYDGYIQTKDRQNQFIFITPSVPASEAAANKKFLEKLEGSITVLEGRFPDLAIEYYGAAPVSLGNAQQIRHDSFLTGSIALVLIVTILFLYFRQMNIILFILAPVLFGAIFSLGTIYFLKGEISAIAIGAGSVILGIGINYSLHFFTHFKHIRSAEQVIKDLALPMLIGACTTVAAFLSLQFAKSQALHDFGLFAGLSLIGAVTFSLLVLPHLLKDKKESGNDAKNPLTERTYNFRPHKNKYVVLGAIALTIFFTFTARYVTFESDMMSMNYQNKDLTRAQARLENINKSTLQSVYISSRGTDLETALRLNEQTTEQLKLLREKNIITEFSSPNIVLISDSLQKVRIERWKSYWTPEKKQELERNIKASPAAAKFRSGAFDNFLKKLDEDPSVIPAELRQQLQTTFTGDWVSEKGKDTRIVNVVKPAAGKKPELYKNFDQDPSVLVFDRQHMTSQFVEIIRSDFNTILLITALLVFVFMLLSHGRIELAIINFLPMFISWIWILGLMGLLGLQFNIINIIISTFIFGLGDDYSIFILDGLTGEYKYGRQTLSSYRGSILLSAATNIIGVGVLIFAEHPALRSIAAITIIGMLTVLAVSFIVQPLLYDLLILDRRRRGLLPYTLFNLAITAVGFLLFMTGSLLLSFAGLLLFYIIPAGKNWKKLIFHYMLMYICRMMIYLFFNVKKKFVNTHLKDFKKPAVIVANHQSHIDLAMILMLHPKIIVFTNDWVWNSPFYGFIIRLADFYPASHGYDKAIHKVKKMTDQGYSVLIFPEGTRSVTGEILRFHKGAFFLARELKLDIQPLLMHGTGDLVTKNDFHFKEGSLTLKYLPRIKHNGADDAQTYQEQAKQINAMMRREYSLLRKEQETVNYYRPRLIKNYIYKGPVLEWYCRIKVKLEGNYRFFESQMPKAGHITDVGCGYGFMSLMFAMMNRERSIEGIDYDEDKIAVARNCVSAGEKVDFKCGDVTEYEFRNSDAFVISDVLHYLKPGQQENLIERCLRKLNPGGVMIIRDADADKKQRHMGTRYTEFFSTNSGFNKTKSDGLHFTSANLIKNTLDKFPGISYEVVDDTKLTSNITFIVREAGKK